MSAHMSRRSFLRGLLNITAFGTLSGSSGMAYAALGEPYWLEISQHTITIPGLPAAAEGLRIAHLSDLHLSEVVSEDYIMQAMQATMQQQPDLILLTGDYVTHGRRYIPGIARTVGTLTAPLGVYASIGNHDHWSGGLDELIHRFEAEGIAVLRNSNTQLNVAGELWLAGIDDVLEQADDLEQAMHGIPSTATTILLAHEPDFADQAAQAGVALQLSGHSHGGQVNIPLIGTPILPSYSRRYPSGLYRVPGSTTQVFTSRGIGLVRPAVRFNCRPEVAILRLHSA